MTNMGLPKLELEGLRSGLHGLTLVGGLVGGHPGWVPSGSTPGTYTPTSRQVHPVSRPPPAARRAAASRRAARMLAPPHPWIYVIPDLLLCCPTAWNIAWTDILSRRERQTSTPGLQDPDSQPRDPDGYPGWLSCQRRVGLHPGFDVFLAKNRSKVVQNVTPWLIIDTLGWMSETVRSVGRWSVVCRWAVCCRWPVGEVWLL